MIQNNHQNVEIHQKSNSSVCILSWCF